MANQLGIQVAAPFELDLEGVSIRFTALLPQFGARLGMIVDNDSDVIWRQLDALVNAGHDFSCVECVDPQELESARQLLADLGRLRELPQADWLRP